ncbi:predicted membrane protein [Microbacterium testaceum StLB037]|uniref:Predicted membrane protein n=1 Tax=Microbacterium testaceum (strain StLB037) TaxID=979556 RepID=E8N8V0_MICTS|nr:cohesin domain-containing protein [Microbacterium testaceum]BAJ73159.1 predicted membrane protein [Microbacterium testaceum StLB037]
MPRLRSRWLVPLLSMIGAITFLGSATPAAMAAESSPTLRATLSAEEGATGDTLALDLGVTGATDLYAATVRIAYDADRVALDPGAVTSDFPGMFSVSGVEGAIDFTVTRLGTSSGRTGDLSLGSLGFVAKGPGEALLRIDQVTLVDSALVGTTLAPSIGLTYTVASSPSTPEPSAPGEQAVPPTVSVTGYGSGVPRGGDTTFRGSAPQSSAAPTATPPRITASSLTPRVGETITLTVRGLTPDAAHRVELHSDPLLLGEATTDEAGSFLLEATIPAAAPTGEHEIVVLARGLAVASLPITIRAADGATSAPRASATPSAGADGDTQDAAADAAPTSADSTAALVWGLAAVVVVLGGAAIVLMRRRSRRAAGDHGGRA